MSQEIKITILGDICPTKDYEELFDNNPNALFSDISAMLQNSDYSICNFECPATDNNNPIFKTGPNLKAKPNVVSLLKEVGFDAVSLANNHILDYGEVGVKDTLNLANDCNLRYFGGGLNKEEAKKPLTVEIKGKKIAFVSFAEHEFNLATENSAGANGFDPYESLDFIRDIKNTSDFVIVLYHGGIEYYKFPSPLLQKKCRAMVDSGADAVFCQHSHCIGTREKYKNAEILYGQGNSIFGYRSGNNSWNEGLVAQITISESNAVVTYSLLCAQENGIKLETEQNTKKRICELEKDSEQIVNKSFIDESWKSFCYKQAPLYLPLLLCWSRVSNKLNRIVKNSLFNLFVKKRAKITCLNLIRCDAHKEVLQTFLENEQKMM